MKVAQGCELSRDAVVERDGGGRFSSKAPSRRGGDKQEGRAFRRAFIAITSILTVLGAAAVCLSSWRSSNDNARAVYPEQLFGDQGDVNVLGIAASSSMWGIDSSLLAAADDERGHNRRSLQLRGKMPARPPVLGGLKPAAGKRTMGEPAMLNDYNKPPLDWIDLDDVQEGYLWIPVAVERFDPSSTDPLVKMCQVNYAKYSQAPWLLPMGGLLALNSGCADLERDTVQLLRMSSLERVLQQSEVEVATPTGFIFHETRCGSTLVANMLASVQTTVMWSESTGPWKLLHTCPKCPKSQIVPWLRTIMGAMSRSARHNQFYFKFQSSEDIDAATTAYPTVPWIFIFREPVEVMMSRLGAQRIGMEGMEKEVTARVVKGMSPVARPKTKQKITKEVTTAQQLAGLCRKAITAYEANPETAMMVEYPHIPNDIIDVVLPRHFRVDVSAYEREQMLNATKKYSKVASFAKGAPDSKFTEDAETKHDAASVAVTEAAQKHLYADYYKLQSLQTW